MIFLTTTPYKINVFKCLLIVKQPAFDLNPLTLR